MNTDASLAFSAKPWRTATEKPFVRLGNVTKNFGAVKAVDDVSLDIYKSELFCLLGGSGSGKSTLLRMLAGFETPDNGTIDIDGQNMGTVPPNERPTNMMFQSYALFPHMSVEKNIAYGLRREGRPNKEIASRVEEMLSLVQLEGYGGRKPHQLSGGQKQRVALARSLIKRPKLLLLDEPLGALDKKLREETQFELVNIQETLGITFIVVTHDQEEAMTLATRIGVMDQGRIVQVGEPNEIYEFPDSKFVADFIGSVNLFEGVVTKDAPNEVRIRSEEANCEFRVAHGISCSPDQRLWYALRPEKMELTHTKPRSKFNMMAGTIDDIAYLGGQSVYRIKLTSGKLIRVTRTNRDRGEEKPFTWDDNIWLTWSANAGVVLTR